MFQWDKIKNRPFQDNDYITKASRIHSDLSYTENILWNILTTNWNSFIYNHVNLGDELLFLVWPTIMLIISIYISLSSIFYELTDISGSWYGQSGLWRSAGFQWVHHFLQEYFNKKRIVPSSIKVRTFYCSLLLGYIHATHILLLFLCLQH